MRRLSADAGLPMLAAACGVLAVVLPRGSVPRGLAAIALVSVLPGAALARALLPDRGCSPERLLVALGMSTAIVALAAIVLYGLGLPLAPGVWAPLLVLVTAAGSAGSIVRRGGSPRGFRPPRLRPREACLLALAITVTGAAVWLGTTPLPPPRDTPGYTALWMEPAGSGRTAVLASSAEMKATSYRLEVTAGKRLVDVSPTFTLRPGQRFREVIGGLDGTQAAVTARLYRVSRGASHLYRQAQLVADPGVATAAISPP